MTTPYENLMIQQKQLREEFNELIEPITDMSIDDIWEQGEYDDLTLQALYVQRAYEKKDFDTPFNEYANKMLKPGYLNELSFEGIEKTYPDKKEMFFEGMKRKNDKLVAAKHWHVDTASNEPYQGEFDHLFKPLRRNWKHTRKDPLMLRGERATVHIVPPKIQLHPHVQELIAEMMQDMIKRKERKLKRRKDKLIKEDEKMRAIMKQKEIENMNKAVNAVKEIQTVSV